ncbi:MAG: VOC family protein [Bacteroidota bacterium]|nr:VOC family protein [Bacteroidota bacterium]
MEEHSGYRVPEKTRIGHIHLKVSDIERSLTFYQDLLGFEVQQRFRDSAVFLSAGGYHHHIALNTWNSKGAPPAPRYGVGLFHTAIVYPTRKDLARIVKRLLDEGYPISGVADHGVSEAIYLEDPDGNGVELYRDRPEADWPRDEQGNLDMTMAEPLDIHELLNELDQE